MEKSIEDVGGFPPNWQGGHELGHLQHSHGPHGQAFRPMGVSKMQLIFVDETVGERVELFHHSRKLQTWHGKFRGWT